MLKHADHQWIYASKNTVRQTRKATRIVEKNPGVHLPTIWFINKIVLYVCIQLECLAKVLNSEGFDTKY